jgi:hypothetical protein
MPQGKNTKMADKGKKIQLKTKFENKNEQILLSIIEIQKKRGNT